MLHHNIYSLIEGSDFEAVAWNFTFSPTAPDLLCVEIAIINDDTPELKEAFSVTIALVMQPDPQVSVQPSTVDISIENDDGKSVIYSLPTKTIDIKLLFT